MKKTLSIICIFISTSFFLFAQNVGNDIKILHNFLFTDCSVGEEYKLILEDVIKKATGKNSSFLLEYLVNGLSNNEIETIKLSSANNYQRLLDFSSMPVNTISDRKILDSIKNINKEEYINRNIKDIDLSVRQRALNLLLKINDQSVINKLKSLLNEDRLSLEVKALIQAAINKNKN